jgi:putative DNA primase/helicase
MTAHEMSHLSFFNKKEKNMTKDLTWCLEDMRQKIGIEPQSSSDLKMSGDLERFMVKDDSSRKQNGAIVFFSDGGYWAQNWKTGETCHGNPQGLHSFSPAQAQLRRKEIAEAKRLRVKEDKARHEKLRERADEIFHSCRIKTGAEGQTHPYLEKKGLNGECYHEFTDSYGPRRLVFPLFCNKRIYSVQFIDEKGNKRFLPGAKKKECYGLIKGARPGKSFLVAEGAATAMSLKKILNVDVFFGLDAYNLQFAIPSILKDFYREGEIKVVIAADMDKNHLGEKSAWEALVKNQLEKTGHVHAPTITGRESADWNDILVVAPEKGPELIRKVFGSYCD